MEYLPGSQTHSRQLSPSTLAWVAEQASEIEASAAEVPVSSDPSTVAIGLELLSPATPSRPPASSSIIVDDDVLLAPTPVRLAVEHVLEAERRVAAASSTRPIRSASVGPDDSGPEDSRGRTRPKRINLQEKRVLMEIAATSCAMKLHPRGKGDFYQFVRRMFLKDNRDLSLTAITKFLDTALGDRDAEIEADDTSGKEIRHGSYWEHLDAVRARLAFVTAEARANVGKRKKKETPQQTAKQKAKEGLAKAYSDKPSEVIDVEDIVDSSEDDGDTARSQSVSYSTASQSVQSSSTLKSARKKAKQQADASAEALSKSIRALARATEDGASEMAAAVGNLGGGADLRSFVEQSQTETKVRLEALEENIDRQLREQNETIKETNNNIASIMAMLQQLRQGN